MKTAYTTPTDPEKKQRRVSEIRAEISRLQTELDQIFTVPPQTHRKTVLAANQRRNEQPSAKQQLCI